MTRLIRAFPPVVGSASRVLILGSMPGAVSLEKQEYYGNPRNQFWTILYGIFGRVPDTVYEKKKAFIIKNKMALWDVIAACRREGSADAAIRDELPADIPGLLRAYPGIRHLFFDGLQAAGFYAKYFGAAVSLPADVLPSTSARNTRPLAEKMRRWGAILKHVR